MDVLRDRVICYVICEAHYVHTLHYYCMNLCRLYVEYIAKVYGTCTLTCTNGSSIRPAVFASDTQQSTGIRPHPLHPTLPVLCPPPSSFYSSHPRSAAHGPPLVCAAQQIRRRPSRTGQQQAQAPEGAEKAEI